MKRELGRKRKLEEDHGGGGGDCWVVGMAVEMNSSR